MKIRKSSVVTKTGESLVCFTGAYGYRGIVRHDMDSDSPVADALCALQWSVRNYEYDQWMRSIMSRH